MGVYIKGLKLPSAERQGELLILTDDGRCVDMFSGEYEAVELQPHGRLIDADELSEKYGDWYTEEGTEEGFIGALKYLIAEQATIIGAEGKQ